MADIKITDLSALTDPQMTDVMPIVDDPAGTPVTKKTTVFNLLMTPVLYSIVAAANFALVAGNTAQAAFDTGGDVFTLKANKTYRFEAILMITKSGSTATTSFGLSLGTATLTSIKYWAMSLLGSVNGAPAAPNLTYVDTNAATVVIPTSTGNQFVRIQGLVRVATGGTITPQITFSASPTTPVMVAGSYIKFEEWSTDTTNTQGAVA